MKIKMKKRYLGLDMDTNIISIKTSQHEDAYMYQATPKQHLKFIS